MIMAMQKKQKVVQLSVIFVAIMSLFVPYGQVFAFDESFYSSNGIQFYDPRSGACSGAGGGTTATILAGDTNQEKIWNYFAGKGLTAEQIAGVMGNIQAESGFDPGIEEIGNSIGFGIVQWSFGRRTALEQAAAQKGVLASDLGFQLDYLYDELNNRPINRDEFKQFGSTEWEGISKQTTIEDALVFFHHEFEISHLMNGSDPRGAVIAARGEFAQHWFTEFSGTTPSTSGSSCGPSAGGGMVHPIADGTRVNEGYGGPRNYGSVTCNGMIWHNGYDLAGERYTTPVVAAHAGVVSVKNDTNNTVTVTHPDGFTTRYLHMDDGYITVADGQNVTAGTQLGFVGNTGYSSGAHLHFEVDVAGNTNPEVAKLPIVPCGGQYVNPGAFMKAFNVELCPNGGCDNPVTS